MHPRAKEDACMEGSRIQTPPFGRRGGGEGGSGTRGMNGKSLKNGREEELNDLIVDSRGG